MLKKEEEERRNRKDVFQDMYIRVKKQLPPKSDIQVLTYNERYKIMNVLPSWLARRDAILFLEQMEDQYPMLDLNESRIFKYWMPVYPPRQKKKRRRKRNDY